MYLRFTASDKPIFQKIGKIYQETLFYSENAGLSSDVFSLCRKIDRQIDR